MANYPGQLTVASALGCSFLTSSGDDGCAAVISGNLRMTSDLRLNSQTIVGGTILSCAPLPVVGPPAEYPTPTALRRTACQAAAASS